MLGFALAVPAAACLALLWLSPLVVDGACAVRWLATALALRLGGSVPAAAQAPAVVRPAGRAVGGFPFLASPSAVASGPGDLF